MGPSLYFAIEVQRLQGSQTSPAGSDTIAIVIRGGFDVPIHDWSRVDAGIFHDFHQDWVQSLKHALNRGVLPEPYYAISEQSIQPVNDRFIPDVLTLEHQGKVDDTGSTGGLLVAPPQTAIVAETTQDGYRRRQNRVAVRHGSDDRVVAVIEIVSAGNKSTRQALQDFVDKTVAFLHAGVHVLIVDLQPPTRRDPNGIHGTIWDEIGSTTYTAPPDRLLTVAAYRSGPTIRAFVEPVAVGDQLPDMPLYLQSDGYVMVPLEATYLATWNEVPLRWRNVIDPVS